MSGRIRIRPKWLSSCSGAELQQMNRLRLKGESMMLEDVLWCPKASRNRIRVFLAKESGNIVGWACALLPPKKKKTCYAVPANTKDIPIYTYVNRAYRGMAIGKRLLKRAAGFTTSQRKRNKYRPTVFFWNEKSSAFFARMQESLPGLQIYDVEEWWDLYDY